MHIHDRCKTQRGATERFIPLHDTTPRLIWSVVSRFVLTAVDWGVTFENQIIIQKTTGHRTVDRYTTGM